jgi:hypothetical protein
MKQVPTAPRPRSGLRLQLGTPVMTLEQLCRIHGEEIARRAHLGRRVRRLDVATARAGT